MAAAAIADRRKRRFLIIGISAILLGIIICLGAGVWFQRDRISDWERMTGEGYDSIFLSMGSMDVFQEEDFTTYGGTNTLKTSSALKNASDIEKYLELALNSENEIHTVYMGVNPVTLWDNAGEDMTRWENDLAHCLLRFIRENPGIEFHVLLPYPNLDYWLSLGEGVAGELNVYSSFIERLYAYENCKTYFVGGEHWLIANPDNYKDEFTANEIISQKILLLTLVDHDYQITPINAPVLFGRLTDILYRETTNPVVYPDLSDWCLVFFGDSIIGNYPGSDSIPGVVKGLSGAQAYNCGLGGVSASVEPDVEMSFPRMAELFVAQDKKKLAVEGQYYEGVLKYMEENHTGKRLCFVLNFGLNDYFGGHPVANPEDVWDVSTYEGAMRSGIRSLQQAYPDAEILVMAPTWTSYFSQGNDRMSEEGGILTEYVDMAVRVSEEMGVYCMNNYVDLEIDESNYTDYLADGCHLNETGRFLLAERIIAFVENHCQMDYEKAD